MSIIIAVLVGLVSLIPAVVYAFKQRRKQPVQAARRLLAGLSGFNLVIVLTVVGLSAISLLAPTPVWAAGPSQESARDPYASLAASIAVGLGSLGAAIAVGNTGAAAIGVIVERPDAFGRVLIFVGLAEGVAIYGLIIAFMVLGR